MNYGQHYQSLKRKVDSLKDSLANRAYEALGQFEDWSENKAGGGAALFLGKSEAYREVAKNVEALLAEQYAEEQSLEEATRRVSLVRNELQERERSARVAADTRKESDPRPKESYLDIAETYKIALNLLYATFPEFKPENQGGRI